MSVSVTNSNNLSLSVTVNGSTAASVTTTSSSVSVTQATAPAAVSVSGKGPKGDTGATGPQGPAGSDGADGANGGTDIVLDNSPQLGADLDVNGNKITSASNGDITIDPDGTGAIILKSDDIQFDGAGTFQGKIKLHESDILGSNFIAISAPLSVTSDTTLTLPDGPPSTNNYALVSNTSGNLSWKDFLDGNTETLLGTTSLKPVGALDAMLAFYDDAGDNYIILRAPDVLTANTTFVLPAADGSANQVLKTDGSGNLSFVDQTTDTNTNLGNSDQTISADRTIELGGNNISIENSGVEKLRIYNAGYIKSTGRIIVDGNGSVGGFLRLGDADSSNTVDLRAPSTISSNLAFVLPASDGTNGQVLQTDGSGNLSFADQSGGGSTLTQVYSLSFIDDIGTSIHYLPFKDINEQTTIYQEEAAMLMPFDGKIRSVSLKCSSLTAGGNLSIKVHTCPTGLNIFSTANWTAEETETMSFTATDDHHTFHFVFDNAQHFEAGDMVAISIQSSVDPGGFAYWHSTAIVDFDTSTDLGSSSTEHDTNP